MRKDIPQEDLEGYLADFRVRQSGEYDSSNFWAYVAGREHGKEIYPAPVPIKASWVSHED
jgi:hypothetical protein